MARKKPEPKAALAVNHERTAVKVAADTMVGDLMKHIRQQLQSIPEPWHKLSEEDQEAGIRRMETDTRAIVEDAVAIIADNGRTSIVATLESVGVKEGIKAVLTIKPSEAGRHELFDSTNQQVLIVLARGSDYGGGAGAVKPDPQQRSLVDELGKVAGTMEAQPGPKPLPPKQESPTTVIPGARVEDPDATPVERFLFRVQPKSNTPASKEPIAGVWAESTGNAWDLYCAEYPQHGLRPEFYVNAIAQQTAVELELRIINPQDAPKGNADGA